MAVQAAQTGPAQSSDEHSVTWSVGLAHEVAARLADPATLDTSLDRLSQLLVDLECTHVSGASPMGHRLASAVAQRNGMALADGAPGGRLAILDAVMNTGVNVVRAMRDARATGAAEVVGVALVAQSIALSAWAREGEILRALEVV